MPPATCRRRHCPAYDRHLSDPAAVRLAASEARLAGAPRPSTEDGVPVGDRLAGVVIASRRTSAKTWLIDVSRTRRSASSALLRRAGTQPQKAPVQRRTA